MSLLNFQRSIVRIENLQAGEVFCTYIDKVQKRIPLPQTLDDAYGNGFLTISLYNRKSETWYLNIGNQEYTGSLHEMEKILYDWSLSEGYKWD
jgi:hypothetical protein